MKPLELPLAWIPNQPGFQFIGITKSGTDIECEVERRPDGTHTLKNETFPTLRAWRNKTP